MIYFDYAANTPALAEVLERFLLVERNFLGNPNSSHEIGRYARLEMTKIVEHMAKLLGVHSGEIIFTSGASEANNLAMYGIAHSASHCGRHIISTALEHSSISSCLTILEKQGFEIDFVDLDENGLVKLDHLKQLLRNDTILVAVCSVDSEIGCIQPIDKISDILKAYPNCHFHVDATQSLGKIDVSFEGIDTVSFTGHKFYGLNGCGVLLKRSKRVMEPLIHGGASTTIYRGGTPTLALAAATETALEIALAEQQNRYEIVQKMNVKLRRGLEAYTNVQINSPIGNAIPHILNVSIKGVKGTVFQRHLDEQGVCVSVKSACATNTQYSTSVYAMTKDQRRALSSWRISLSHLTTEENVEKFFHAFDVCYQTLVK
ncbi:MAG: cysteine desulfurase family protein [Anaerotignum sp.]